MFYLIVLVDKTDESRYSPENFSRGKYTFILIFGSFVSRKCNFRKFVRAVDSDYKNGFGLKLFGSEDFKNLSIFESPQKSSTSKHSPYRD